MSHANTDADHDGDRDTTADENGARSAADFFVTRDEHGELNTVTKRAGPYGEVEVRPMVYGTAERMFGDQGSAAMIGPEVVAELLRDYVVDPDLEAHAEAEYGRDDDAEYALNARVVREEMEPFAPMLLMRAVFDVSGFSPEINMDQGGNAALDFETDDEEGN